MNIQIGTSYIPCELCNANVCEYKEYIACINPSFEFLDIQNIGNDWDYAHLPVQVFSSEYSTGQVDYESYGKFGGRNKIYPPNPRDFLSNVSSNEEWDLLEKNNNIYRFDSASDLHVCKQHGVLLLEIELLQALMMFFSNKDKNVLYVNVYKVTQAYGGREEGGWWYDCGIVKDSQPVLTPFYLGTEDAVETFNEYEDEPILESPYPRTIGYAEFLEACFPSFFKMYQRIKEFESEYADKGSKHSYTSASGDGYEYRVGLSFNKEGFPKRKPYYS